MEKFRSIKLQWLQGQLTHVTSVHSHLKFAHFPTGLWEPAVNAFQCDDALRICVDLAGVQKDEVDVIVEPGLLKIQGVRIAPEPAPCERKPIRVLALEIDSGRFAREIRIPSEVNIDGVSAEQKNGLLWIHLPLQ